MPQEKINTPNENNRQAQETLFREPEDKNDSVRLPSRYEQYAFAKRHLRGSSRPQVFPLGEDDRKTDELPGHIANTPTARYEGAQATGTYVGEGKLDAQEIMAYSSSQRKDHVEHRIKIGEANCLTTGNGCAGGMKSMSFVASKPNTLTSEMKIRRLTPVECERLQGFPDGWTSIVSDTQRYKTLGNAVTVNVIRDILVKLL